MGTETRAFLFQKIRELKPRVIGFSLFANNRLVIAGICRRIKSEFPKIKIVLGGPQVTGNISALQEKWDFVDSFFAFRAEADFYGYLTKILKPGREAETACSSGLWSAHPPVSFGAVYENIITSTGCPGVCIFCSSPYLWKNRIDFRKTGDIADEIEMLYKKGVKRFVFSDDTFTVNFKRLSELFSILEKRKIFISWDARTRVDCIDPEKIRYFRKMGCSSLSFGIESASPAIIKRINKKIDIEQAAEIIKTASASGIYTNLFFIIGLPGETEETVEENIAFVKKTRPSGITAAILHYIPESGLENEFGSKDWTDLNGPETYYFNDETEFSVLQERKEYFQARCQQYINKRDIKTLESLNCQFPDQPDILADLAAEYEIRGDLKKAGEYYRRSLDILFIPGPAVSLGLLLKQLGNKNLFRASKLFKKARKELDFLIKNGIRTNANSFYLRCLCHIENNNLRKALSDIRACIDFEPDNIPNIETAAWICMEMEKDGRALEFLNMIPGDARKELWYYNSIICCHNMGRIKEAKRMIKYAKNNWPDCEFFYDFQ
jgi:uncharacterized radical SAM superfamily protein